MNCAPDIYILVGNFSKTLNSSRLCPVYILYYQLSRYLHPNIYIWMQISRKLVVERGSVPKDHQYEMEYGESIGYVTDNVA